MLFLVPNLKLLEVCFFPLSLFSFLSWTTSEQFHSRHVEFGAQLYRIDSATPPAPPVLCVCLLASHHHVCSVPTSSILTWPSCQQTEAAKWAKFLFVLSANAPKSNNPRAMICVCVCVAPNCALGYSLKCDLLQNLMLSSTIRKTQSGQ